MNKKAQGLSMNVIIIAALGLIVLVIMVLIFTGQIGVFSKSVSCEARGGECLEDIGGNKCPDHLPIKIYTQNCPLLDKGGAQVANKKQGQCCIPLG